MKKRSIAAVVLLPFVTLGIYTIYWYVSTKGELNQKGANIPTAWLLIIPFVSIWWMWKYYEGAEHVTSKKVNGVLMFILGVFVTSLISSALCQDAYNSLSEVYVPQDPPTAPEPAASTEPMELSTSSIESTSTETSAPMEPEVSSDSQPSGQTQEDSSVADKSTPIKTI